MVFIFKIIGDKCAFRFAEANKKPKITDTGTTLYRAVLSNDYEKSNLRWLV